MSGAHSQSPRLRHVGSTAVESLSARVISAVQALAFWLAVTLPLAYLPLVVDGLSAGEHLPFLALLAANVLALTVGHDHAR